MTEETTSPTTMDYGIESASGAHFSGLLPDGLLDPSTSSPSSLSSAPTGDSSASPKQPFVIGKCVCVYIYIYNILNLNLGKHEQNR
jgi:uridine kinase